MAPIILYDIPSKTSPPTCWSPNPWKARIVLNFKGLPYETQWLEYPEIAPTLKSLGVSPIEGAPAAYSSPTVRFEDGQVVMESLQIAHEVEKRYPEPTLRLDSPYIPQALQSYAKIAPILAPVLIPQVPRKFLRPASVGYFESTRAKRFGMSLDDYEKAKGGDSAWADAKDEIDKLAKLLNENAGGPFFHGNSPCFGDAVVAGFLEFMRTLDQEAYARFIAHDAAFAALHAASADWLKRKS